MPDAARASSEPRSQYARAHGDTATGDCMAACLVAHDACVAAVEHCLRRSGDHADARHIRTLLDAARASDVSREFMLRGSKLYKLYCRAAAHANDEAAQTCEHFAHDEVLLDCAAACRRCAEACRDVGGVMRR